MSKYSKQNKVSELTREEASKIARGTQRPGQTKEQTRLIAQGIQKGIDLYKKQQKVKARELDKKLKKVTSELNKKEDPISDSAHQQSSISSKLPWVLLLISWIIFTLYVFYTMI